MINKRLIALILVLAVACLSGCTNKQEEKLTEDTKPYIPVENTESKTSETIKIKNTDIENALKQNKLISKNFTFEVSNNQQIEITDDGNYIGEETWIYKGILNKGITDLIIEGDNAEYSVSITFGSNKEYPSNISVTFVSENETDLDNMLAWTYETIGIAVPPKLAKAFQNAGFKGLTEKCYTENGIQADVYKENIKNENNTVTSTLSILISDGVDEVVYADKDKFSVGDIELEKYGIKVIKQGDTISNIESSVSSLFDSQASTITQIASVYENKGITDTIESLYTVFNTEINGMDLETTIIVSGDSNLTDGSNNSTITINTGTNYYNSKTEAVESAKKLLEEITGCEAKVISDENFTDTKITVEKENILGFPLKFNITIQGQDEKYRCTINGGTQVEE